MPRVSKKLLQKEKLEEIENSFSDLIASLTHKEDISQFFHDFLTPEEKTMLSKRLMLFLLMKKGYKTADIKESLNISYETIRSYSKVLAYKTEKFHAMLEKLLKGEKAKRIWQKIDSALKPFSLMMKAQHDMKARAKVASGDFSDD